MIKLQGRPLVLEFRQFPAWAQHSTTGAVPTQPSASKKDGLSAPASDDAAAVESLKVALEAEKQKHHVRTHFMHHQLAGAQ
jgi:hypothetical protein